MDEYVTQDQLKSDYISWDQYWTEIRQLSTDLKGEILARPLEVTVDVPPIASASFALMAGACLYAVIVNLIDRWASRRRRDGGR